MKGWQDSFPFALDKTHAYPTLSDKSDEIFRKSRIILSDV